jgi:hypothetical protein
MALGSDPAAAAKRGNPARAVELLAPVTPYEAGWNDRLLAAYLRGEAWLAEHRGEEAATEFQRIVSHPGVAPKQHARCVGAIGPRPSLCALEGDRAKAVAACQDFLGCGKTRVKASAPLPSFDLGVSSRQRTSV